jgi:hypothetical protein
MILISGATPEVTLPIDLLILIEERMACMAPDEPFDPDLHGLIVVVQSGDTAEQLAEAISFDILSNPWSEARFGEANFEPLFEVLEEHDCCFELVIVPSDGDYGIVIFVQKEFGVDPLLLSFCQTYASPAP